MFEECEKKSSHASTHRLQIDGSNFIEFWNNLSSKYSENNITKKRESCCLVTSIFFHLKMQIWYCSKVVKNYSGSDCVTKCFSNMVLRWRAFTFWRTKGRIGGLHGLQVRPFAHSTLGLESERMYIHTTTTCCTIYLPTLKVRTMPQ